MRVRRKLKLLWRSLRYGVLNLRDFFGVVWYWRSWSWEYSYRLMLRGLQLQARRIAKLKYHQEWRKDVDEIHRLLDLWEAYMEARDIDEEEERWAAMHDHLKDSARRWWH